MILTRSSFIGGMVAALTPINPIPINPVPSNPINQIPSTTATIGIVGPFTGNDQNLGEQLANGARQAIQEANQLRGSFDTIFALRILDDQNLLAQAMVTAQLAVDDSSVLCVVGHLSGHVTESALRTYVNAQMPVIIPASSYDRLTSYGYGGILRLPTKDSTEGRLAAEYVLKERKVTRVAVLYQDGDYGFDVANGFATRIDGDKIPCQSIKFSSETPLFDDAARQTMSATPDLIFLAGSVTDMGPIVAALRTAKYAGPLFASQGFFSATTTDKYGSGVEGLIVSSSIPPFQLAPNDLRLIQDFQQNYGNLTPLAALAYAGTQVAIAAIRRTGSSNRLAVWRAFQTPASYDTLIGTFAFLSSGDQVEPNVYFYEVQNGKWSYLRSAHTTSFLPR